MIELGRTYKDKVSGFEGIAVSITRYLHACERVCLQMVAKDGDIKESVFDAPQLELKAQKRRYVFEPKPAALTGGDRPIGSRARSNSR